MKQTKELLFFGSQIKTQFFVKSITFITGTPKNMGIGRRLWDF